VQQPQHVVVESTPVLRDGRALVRSSGSGVYGVGHRSWLVPPGNARVLVCIAGDGEVEYDDETYGLRRGEVLLLSAAVGACVFRPAEEATLLEVVALPGIVGQ